MKKGIKIVIADPSVIILNGLTVMLQELTDYDVVLASTDLHTLIPRMHILNPDILIVNPLMIDYGKRMMVRELFSDLPHTRIVALTNGFVESQQLRQYHGIIEITDDLQRIKSTLNQVRNVLATPDDEPDISPLSEREKDVLVCLAKGQKNNEIAKNLHISPHTVITHRKNIVKKTGIKSVAALTVYAILNNLIDEKDVI